MTTTIPPTPEERAAALAQKIASNPILFDLVQRVGQDVATAGTIWLRLGFFLAQGEYEISIDQSPHGPWRVWIYRPADKHEIEMSDASWATAITRTLQAAEDEQQWQPGSDLRF